MLAPSSCTTFLLLLFLIVIAISLIHDIPLTSTSLVSLRFRPSNSVDIAYFIQIVPSTLAHLPRLFGRVYHPGNVYALHFDVKIPQSHVEQSMTQLQSSIPSLNRNTYVVPSDVIVYNGVSMILNTLAAINYLLDLKHPWTFFINLSGSDYPLTDAYLPRQLLAQALPYSPIFFSLAEEENWMIRFKKRAEDMFIDPSLTHSVNYNPPLIETPFKNPIFDNITFIPVHAEAWMILPRQFCTYVSTSPKSRRMLLSLANMRGSDEYFFSTLAYNHPVFNKSIVPHSFRKVIWTHDGTHAGQHPYHIDESQNGRWIFLAELLESPQWHARKFLHSDSSLMDQIDNFSNDPQRVSMIRREFGKVINRLRHRFTSTTQRIQLTPADFL